MPRTEKTADHGRAPFRRLSDSEILLFVTRTLQPHLDDADTSVVTKLQSLRDILGQQEKTLAEWPDLPGKDRMGDDLAGAKNLVAQIVDDLANAARRDGAANAAKSA